LNQGVFGFFPKKNTQGEKPEAVPVPENAQAKQQAAILAGLKNAIKANQANDPLAGPKVAAEEIRGRLMRGLKNEKGVHIESLLTALGALAGFSCQISVRAKFGAPPKSGAVPRVGAFVVAKGADGKNYFFGDNLNKPLLEDKYSIWSLAAGGAQTAGVSIPDLGGIVKHVAATVGGAKFGIPRIPDNHRPGDLPFNYLKVIWPHIFPPVVELCPPSEEWPIAFGIAAQRTILASKDVINPMLGVSILMESAIPMSKVEMPAFY
jgi:hypothetical protein